MVESLRPLKSCVWSESKLSVSKIATEMCCFHCKLNHRLFSCVDYVANNEQGAGLFGTVRSCAEALTTKPATEQLELADAVCVVFLFACMYVCVCVWVP